MTPSEAAGPAGDRFRLQFGILHPSRHPRADANEAWLGPLTLGIEVTEPTLAARCGLGNMDPQHGRMPLPDQAAIDLALDWPLPPGGSRLVTLRADSDSVGAMAVLSLRHSGVALDRHAVARVRAISQWDRHDHGGWLAWQRRNPPLPLPANMQDLGGPPSDIKAIRACAADSGLAMADRVAGIAKWLTSGTISRRSEQLAIAFDEALLADWNEGHIRITATPAAHLILLQSHRSAGFILGYRQAPVVIAEGQVAGHRKLSIGQFEPGWIDMAKLQMRLAKGEDGWGGSATMIGSPQGAASRIATADIIGYALACLT